MSWLPSGRQRVGMDLSDEEHFWRAAKGHQTGRIPPGRCLCGGAESDMARSLASNEPAPDVNGDACVGLHHP